MQLIQEMFERICHNFSAIAFDLLVRLQLDTLPISLLHRRDDRKPNSLVISMLLYGPVLGPCEQVYNGR